MFSHKYKQLNKKCETVIKCLPDAPFRYVVSGTYEDLFAEIDRLNRVIVLAHDGLLRGEDDKEILETLSKGWTK